MYYSDKQLDDIKKKAEEYQEEMRIKKEGVKYSLQDGTQISCIFCKHDHFYQGKALLNTRAATFFGFDWLNNDAIILSCSRCGYIHWFTKEVKEIK